MEPTSISFLILDLFLRSFDSDPRQDHARTDFAGLFRDSCSTADQPMVNESEVVIDEVGSTTA